ncbi:restriction endonuclease subunit S [Tissierella carlieri]|uniref:restriction endonuclease subunit S n=1 Tax=Tissierella carlieri TaxID=689904 RepID=UPI001C124321|nr:restriction endonuclease subunit S [Tissierella carlieri]MDD4549392.1 restriction endonuclease subunit S [Syntrophomonadaceae bacterium]
MNDKMNNTEKQALVDWNSLSLGKLTLSSDYGTSKKTNDNTGIPVLRMGNMKDGKIVLDNLVFLELENSEFQRLKLYPGDILINRTNSADLVGKVSIFDLDGDYVCASYIVRFKINQEIINPYYLNYYMNMSDSQNRIKTIATQAIQQANINPTTLKKSFIVKFPKSKHEQDKIVKIISTWDKAIELKEKLIDEKKKQKAGLMQKLLTGNVRFTGFNDAWEEVKFGKVFKFLNKERVSEPQNYKLLTVKLHLKGIEATEKYPNDTKNGRPYYLREPNEILIGRQNYHNGGIGIVPSNMKNYIASNAISSLTTIKGDLMFLFYYISNVDFYKRVGHMIGGTGQKEISETTMKNLVLRIPKSLEEQKKIGEVLKTADNEIDLLEKELESLKQQKKGLMQLLLTGIIRVNTQENEKR